MELVDCVFLACIFAYSLSFGTSYPVVKPQGKMASELPQNFDPSQLNMDIVAEWLNKLKYNQEAADPSSTDISDDSSREDSTERKNPDQDSTARSRRHQKTSRDEWGNERGDEKAKKRMNKLEKLFRRSYRKEEPGKMYFLLVYIYGRIIPKIRLSTGYSLLVTIFHPASTTLHYLHEV